MPSPIDEPGLVPLWSVFRDTRREQAFVEFRRADDLRAATLALLAGGLAYAGAAASDGMVFAGFPAELVWVRLCRALGVVLCLACAAWIHFSGSLRVLQVACPLAMLGTLATYSGIALFEENLRGGSDYRMVFSVFSLLAFIFFPIRIATSAILVLGMLVEVVILHVFLEKTEPASLTRTLALMLTFGVAGASFSITNNRARRKEFILRRRKEEALEELSREVEARRLAEVELERHRHHLEELVLARTAELETSQRQLVAAQRVEALGQLAGGLAHDFNNLLVTIMGNAELTLDSRQIAEDVRENQENILQASQRASKLARDLLAGSRKQVMEPEVLDPSLLVGRLERILTTAVGHRAALSIRCEPTATVVGARGPLEQVLLNLVLNARDAAQPDGHILVRVESVTLEAGSPVLPPAAEPGSFVRISVQDDGPGVPLELRERIFEPFFTTKDESAGTGLGLSVVRGVVEQHGGFIHLASEPGHGSTFAVHLPTSRERATAGPASGRRESRGGTERILVVDDDRLVLRLVHTALEKAGYKVITAGSGAEALGLLSSPGVTVDLVLSDLVMPPLGGRQLMEKARAVGVVAPFLFCSGYSDGGVYRGFVLERGVHFLAKPFSAAELTQKVRQVLDQRAVLGGEALA